MAKRKDLLGFHLAIQINTDVKYDRLAVAFTSRVHRKFDETTAKHKHTNIYPTRNDVVVDQECGQGWEQLNYLPPKKKETTNRVLSS